MSTCFDLKSLSVCRGRELVLDDLNFSIECNQITGLTGPNGGGKTTLFETFDGLCEPSSGEILWSRPLELAYLPQQLLPKKVLPLTVKDFVEMGQWGPAKKSSPALSIDEAVRILKLNNFTSNLLAELSGGEWRRALLARCLVQSADLYLLDEPFNQLDLEMEARLGELLMDLAHRDGKTFLVISHDWHAMDHYFDKLILLNKKLIAMGPVREVNEFYMNWKNPDHHKRIHHS